MDLGYLPPISVGLTPAAARDLMFQTLKLAAAARPLLTAWQAAAVFGTIMVAWLINSMDWGFGSVRFMVAACAASLTATAALALGWATDPRRTGGGGPRAPSRAALASPIPILPGEAVSNSITHLRTLHKRPLPDGYLPSKSKSGDTHRAQCVCEALLTKLWHVDFAHADGLGKKVRDQSFVHQNRLRPAGDIGMHRHRKTPQSRTLDKRNRSDRATAAPGFEPRHTLATWQMT